MGLVRIDGAPIERGLIGRLTKSMTLRGPDEQRIWCGGQVALGHALLRTTDESQGECQPFSLDGLVWIVADARVDARPDLLRELDDTPKGVLEPASDGELILRAYHRWGEQCVEHLLGDFAFAIWDGRAQRLFCARDHMGVKPFYYSSVGRWIACASALETLRAHPAVSNELNDLAIADFLLFGHNQDASTTSFKDIQRLPPAHTLTWSGMGLRLRRYWTLPVDPPVYFRRNWDYIDRFNELIRQAVSDRLRGDRVGIFMSGGLDSTALAATSKRLLSSRGKPEPVRAFTFVYNSLMADSEQQHAEAAAKYLAIPIDYYALDSRDGWLPSLVGKAPEPVGTMVHRDEEFRCYTDMAAHSRVAFYGEGPDNALTYEWQPHLQYLLRQRRLARLVADLGKHLVSHKRIPILPTIPRMLRDRRDRNQHEEVFPPWISAELASRFKLEQRWRELYQMPTSSHPTRPKGYASLLTSQWQSLFESLEPSYTGVSMEVRHPYIDIRLLRFLLAIPSVPWCRSKYLLRQALKGVVPEVVRRRPKTPLARNPDRERVRQFRLPAANPSRSLGKYGDARKLSEGDTEDVHPNLRFIAFSYWLNELTVNNTQREHDINGFEEHLVDSGVQ